MLVTEFADALVGFAAQDAYQVAHAVRLPGTPDAGQRLARGFGGVPGLRRVQAVVAVAAGGGGFIETGQDVLAAAGGALRERHELVKALVGAALEGVAAVAVDDALAVQGYVAAAPTHPGVRGQAVAPGASGFLVVTFDGGGQVEVGDKAHVRFVYAHAEGDGGDHDDAGFGDEALLVGAAHVGFHAGVVGQRVEALFA